MEVVRGSRSHTVPTSSSLFSHNWSYFSFKTCILFSVSPVFPDKRKQNIPFHFILISRYSLFVTGTFIHVLKWYGIRKYLLVRRVKISLFQLYSFIHNHSHPWLGNLIFWNGKRRIDSDIELFDLPSGCLGEINAFSVFCVSGVPLFSPRASQLKASGKVNNAPLQHRPGWLFFE